MAIRIRKVGRHIIAVCAAATKPKKGDLYLDDTIHEALADKFALDFYTMGVTRKIQSVRSQAIVNLIKKEESKNRPHRL